MSSDTAALINYYARVGHHRTLQTVCSEVLKRKQSDATLLLWRAFGVAKEGGYTEAIRQLDAIKAKRGAGKL